MSLYLDIHKKLGDFSLDISFVSDSRRIGILGTSGCGKSMTLKCIAGIEVPDYGEIRVDKRTLFHSVRRINPRPQKRNVGFLFQNYALFPVMTVEENIGIGIKGDKRKRDKVTADFIERFGLQGLERRYPSELSGGQQQRVALARILVYEPDIILLDEPFSALDIYLKDRLQRELASMLEGYKGTVILVSHNRDEIYRFSEELLVIDNGQTICSGNTKELFDRPVRKEAAVITGCKNIVDVRKIDNHSLFIPEWNITLNLEQSVEDEISWIGIRAHDFLPIWTDAEHPVNSLPIREYRIDHLPFESNYYLKVAKEQKEDICWFVQRESLEKIERMGMPDYLMIPEEKLLLLR